MRSFLQPLEALQARASFFAAAPELRLLAIATDDLLRNPVVAQMMALEHHADNRTAFVRLDEPYTADRPGWSDRADRVIETLAAHRTAHEAKGVVLAPPKVLLEPAENEVVHFARELSWFDETARGAPLALDGVTAVLAPHPLADGENLARDIVALVRTPTLSRVRWILVDGTPGATCAAQVARELGDGALFVACKVDEVAHQREIAARIAAAAKATSAAPQALAGAAWPAGVTPPDRARVGRTSGSAAAIPADLVALAKRADQVGQLGRLVLSAAEALSRSDVPGAIHLQLKASDLAAATGLPAETVKMKLLLGTYQLQLARGQGGGPPAALATFEDAARSAEQQGLTVEAAQASLGLAQLHLLAGDKPRASAAFARAGRLAAKGNSTLLAIEGFRAAGQVAIEGGAEQAAIDVWRDGLDIARKGDPDDVRASSAAEVARFMAAAYRRHVAGEAKALELDQVASEIEDSGVVPPFELGLDRTPEGS